MPERRRTDQLSQVELAASAARREAAARPMPPSPPAGRGGGPDRYGKTPEAVDVQLNQDNELALAPCDRDGTAQEGDAFAAWCWVAKGFRPRGTHNEGDGDHAVNAGEVFYCRLDPAGTWDAVPLEPELYFEW